MNAVTDLINECTDARVDLFLDNGRLRYRSQPGAYTEDLRQRVAVHRDAVIAALDQREVLAAVKGGCGAGNECHPGGVRLLGAG